MNRQSLYPMTLEEMNRFKTYDKLKAKNLIDPYH